MNLCPTRMLKLVTLAALLVLPACMVDTDEGFDEDFYEEDLEMFDEPELTPQKNGSYASVNPVHAPAATGELHICETQCTNGYT